MSVNTLLYDFRLTADRFSQIENDLIEVIRCHLKEVTVIHRTTLEDGGTVYFLIGAQSSSITVRFHPTGTLTVNIEYRKEEGVPELLTVEASIDLEKEIVKRFNLKEHVLLPGIRRGTHVNRYYATSDERLIEYDFDAILFDEHSKYQRVQIVHSNLFGNVLILDSVLNLSTADAIYTETIMQKGKESYEGKEILILGGGDGVLLYELLKENPKKVLMFELDEVVIKACRQHMRESCGDVLDNFKGPNYEIILGDCTVSMDQMIAKGETFDYIFGDLTDFPLNSLAVTKQNMQFLKTILNRSLKILRPRGKYMAHSCGKATPSITEQYNTMLDTLDSPVEYTTCEAFIPSFLESWLFYQIWKK